MMIGSFCKDVFNQLQMEFCCRSRWVVESEVGRKCGLSFFRVGDKATLFLTIHRRSEAKPGAFRRKRTHLEEQKMILRISEVMHTVETCGI